MFVGIICACMPAAAHTCHHHLPSYDSIKNILRSHYGSLGQRLRRPNPTSSTVSERNSRDLKTPRGVYEGYVNLGGLDHARPVPAKSLQTFVHNGSPDDFSHDGIHLTYEMQQISASAAPHHQRQTAV